MKRVVLLAAALVLGAVSAAGAITKGGELDGDAHPYVGLMVADDADGNPMWRCSGTLISPTLYVTAGHCTFGAERAQLWFQSDLEPDPASVGYPGFPNQDASSSVTGTPYTFPLYSDDAFYLYDLGVVVLDEPITGMTTFGELPTVGQVDTLGKGRKSAVVTAVGYGLQQASDNPAIDRVIDDKTRYQAELFVVDTNGVAGIGSIPGSESMSLSGDAKHGGTCFGDSGGPAFAGDTNVILGVTSFGLNGTCGGIGGTYRIDGQAQIDWILSDHAANAG